MVYVAAWCPLDKIMIWNNEMRPYGVTRPPLLYTLPTKLMETATFILVAYVSILMSVCQWVNTRYVYACIFSDHPCLHYSILIYNLSWQILHDKVRVLDLTECDISDAALHVIGSKCPLLRKIDLNSTKVPRTSITSDGELNKWGGHPQQWVITDSKVH